MSSVPSVEAARTADAPPCSPLRQSLDLSVPRRQLGVVLVAPPYFDVPPKSYGGIEAVVADLADALVARGHSVVLVGAGQPGTSARFVSVWEHTVPEQLGQAYPEVMHAAAVRRAIEQLVVTDDVDVVHD
ncbi:MAG: glycosyltransferase, partial [Pseudonocardiaceae bacterium]